MWDERTEELAEFLAEVERRLVRCDVILDATTTTTNGRSDMRFERVMWNGGPMLTFETNGDTVIVAEGPHGDDGGRYGGVTVGVVSRFATFPDVFPILSIGSGYGAEHAIEAALDGFLQRGEAFGRDMEAEHECPHGDDWDSCDCFSINGALFSFDVDGSIGFVLLGGSW